MGYCHFQVNGFVTGVHAQTELMDQGVITTGALLTHTTQQHHLRDMQRGIGSSLMAGCPKAIKSSVRRLRQRLPSNW